MVGALEEEILNILFKNLGIKRTKKRYNKKEQLKDTLRGWVRQKGRTVATRKRVVEELSKCGVEAHWKGMYFDVS